MAAVSDTALFYAHKIVEEGWSRNVLKSFIDTNLHLRQGKALTSFPHLLPAPDSDLAQELTKDPYIFDFTEMTEPYKERKLNLHYSRSFLLQGLTVGTSARCSLFLFESRVDYIPHRHRCAHADDPFMGQ